MLEKSIFSLRGLCYRSKKRRTVLSCMPVLLYLRFLIKKGPDSFIIISETLWGIYYRIFFYNRCTSFIYNNKKKHNIMSMLQYIIFIKKNQQIPLDISISILHCDGSGPYLSPPTTPIPVLNLLHFPHHFPQFFFCIISHNYYIFYT